MLFKSPAQILFAAALCVAATSSNATVLTFEDVAIGAAGNLLTSGYGDRAAGTENVVADFGVSEENIGGERLSNHSLYVWRNGSNADNRTHFLTSPAGKGDWAWQGEAGFLATLTADPGYEVTIDSFDFLTTNRFDDGDVSALKIMNQDGDVVWAQMFADAVQPNRAFTYTPGVSGQSLTLVLQGPAGQGGYNLGLDNVAFSQARANPGRGGGGGAIPAPGGLAMIGAGAAALARRRRKRAC